MARMFRAGNYREIPQGACWIRDGESNQQIDKQQLKEDDHQYSYAEVPYLLPSMWQRYLSNLDSDQNIVDAARVLGYQELSVQRSGERLADTASMFLASSQQLLVLQGTAGSGKSVFLRRMAKELVQAGLAALGQIRADEEFRPPPGWIPCYLSLQGEGIKDTDQLINRLLDTVNRYGAFWSRRPRRRDQLFCLPRLRWVIILDGLDEIWSHRGQQRFLSALRGFMDLCPSTKLLLSTRDADIIDWNQWPSSSIEKISPLDEFKIKNYVGVHASGERFNEIMDLLRHEPDFLRLCSHPVYLAAAMDELVGEPVDVPEEATIDIMPTQMLSPMVPEPAETEWVTSQLKPVSATELQINEPLSSEMNVISEQYTEADSDLDIRVPIVLDRIYRRLWNRERARRADAHTFGDILWNQTGKIALDTDGHRSIFPNRVAYRYLGSSEKRIFWLLSLGVLESHDPQKNLRFNTRLTQVYFASSYLLPLLEYDPSSAFEDALSKASDDFRARVLAFLEHLSTSGHERISR